MKLTKIDLSQIVAVGHNKDQLGLIIDRGSEIEYIEVPAPKAAYYGLQEVSNFINARAITASDQDPLLLKDAQPLDRCEESRFLSDSEDDQETECLIELDRSQQDNSEYYSIDLEDQEPFNDTSPCDQLLSFRVPGYSLSTD